MNRSPRFQIATRIDATLMQALGEPIDMARLAAEPRYARDVLLVCDSIGGEAAELARAFRAAAADAPAAPGPDVAGPPAPPRLLDSLFGAFSPAARGGTGAAAPKAQQRGVLGRWRR